MNASWKWHGEHSASYKWAFAFNEATDIIENPKQKLSFLSVAISVICGNSGNGNINNGVTIINCVCVFLCLALQITNP